MLEYGLIDPPKDGQFWELHRSPYSREHIYLHLRENRKFLGIKYGKTVHEDMVSNYAIKVRGYEQAVREAAENVVREVNVNFNLPTGRVR